MLFGHAILGCDTTSRVCSIGKGLALKHISSDKHFITQAEVFLQENATQADISSAGEGALVWLYTGAMGDTLDKLRLLRFHQKVATSTRFVQPENLHPTSLAAKYHSLRMYFQVQLGLVHICTQTTSQEEMDMPFDGYQEEISTKDGAHERRTGGRAGPSVYFTRNWSRSRKRQGQQAAIREDASSKLGTRWMRNTSCQG